jgi:hypothetical protein
MLLKTMGVCRLFFQGRAKFSKGGRGNIIFSKKNTATSKKYYFWDKNPLTSYGRPRLKHM